MGHRTKEWKEAEYYDVDRVEVTRKMKRRVQIKVKEITIKV